MKDSKDTLRQSLVEKINKTLDISPEALPSGTLITIAGHSSVCFEGKIKILLYSPEKIRISLGKEVVCLVGRRLICSSYSKRQLTACGEIHSVSFEEVDHA